MIQHQASKTRKKYTAFLAGHLNSPYNDPYKLKTYFSSRFKGFVNIEIPSKKWKGYGFVIFSSKKYLDMFISKKEIHLG